MAIKSKPRQRGVEREEGRAHTNVPGAGRTMESQLVPQPELAKDEKNERKKATCGELHFSAIFYTHLKSHTERESERENCAAAWAKGRGVRENAAVAAVSKQERQTAMRVKINAGERQS